MYRKYIEHLMMVSLQYFFNFDFSFLKNILLMAIVLLYSCRTLFVKVAGNFYDSALTIKEDLRTIAATVNTLKDRWYTSELREALINNVRALKN